MDEQLHVIIAGEEGGSRSISFTKKRLYSVLVFSSVFLICLVIGCFFTTKHTMENVLMERKITSLETKIAQLKQDKNTLINQKDAIVDENKKQLADIKVRHDLETTTLKLENAKLISNAVSELNERSDLIESVMSTVGVKLKKEKVETSNDNSGGIYIPMKDSSYDDLLNRADDYLKTIKSIPIGRPTPGPITSRYGKRRDPLNGNSAFHTGVDIRGKRGDKIYATADGIVTEAFNNGGFGKYVEISHGNGYKTRFAHMQSYVVRKGEKVRRGQLIGQVGNSGRSTGPHLHYEIVLGDKTINPVRFLKIADISHTFKSGKE